jgi:hypothetical protein
MRAEGGEALAEHLGLVVRGRRATVVEPVTLTRFGGHLILPETSEEGALVGSSAGVPREAVELVRTSHRSVIEVARSRITDSMLHN